MVALKKKSSDTTDHTKSTSILIYQIDVNLESNERITNYADNIRRRSVYKNEVELANKNDVDLSVNSTPKKNQTVMKIDGDSVRRNGLKIG